MPDETLDCPWKPLWVAFDPSCCSFLLAFSKLMAWGCWLCLAERGKFVPWLKPSAAVFAGSLITLWRVMDVFPPVWAPVPALDPLVLYLEGFLAKLNTLVMSWPNLRALESDLWAKVGAFVNWLNFSVWLDWLFSAAYCEEKVGKFCEITLGFWILERVFVADGNPILFPWLPPILL